MARSAGAALLLVILLAGLVWLAGCTTPVQTAVVSSQVTSTQPQTETSSPVIPATDTPGAAAPEDAQLTSFTSQYGVSFQYPKDWSQVQTEQQVETFQLTGTTSPGFVSLSPLGAGTDYQDLARRCAWEANGNPSAYGDHPKIQMEELQQHDICFIQPSLSGIKATTAFLFLANTSADSQVIRLSMDLTHIKIVGQSLRFNAAQPTATPEPVQLTPNAPKADSQPDERALGDLQLSEYAVVRAGEDTPVHFEFNQRIPKDLLAKRSGLGVYAQDEGLSTTNLQLEPFGYSLETRQEGTDVRYDLRQGNGIIKAGLSSYSTPSVYRDAQGGGDFAMIVEDANWQRWLVRKDSIEPWDDMLHRYTRPVFVGSHLITVERTVERPALSGESPQSDWVIVKQNGQPIFTYALAPQGTHEPVRTLASWDGHWVLEIDGTLIVDGLNWNLKDFPADEIFNWTLLKGKPFFFFRRDGKVGAWYNGQELPVQYDQVIHYRCCEPAAFNIITGPNGLWFYALRDGVWYFASLQ